MHLKSSVDRVVARRENEQRLIRDRMKEQIQGKLFYLRIAIFYREIYVLTVILPPKSENGPIKNGHTPYVSNTVSREMGKKGKRKKIF